MFTRILTAAALLAGFASVIDVALAQDEYQSALLEHHNIHRSNHSAPDVTWDSNLANIANEIASSCVYAHDTETGGGGYGQNIGAGYSNDAGGMANMITNSMYNGEMPNFTEYGVDSPNMDNFGSWGHFSQIVWKDTTAIGCSTVHCDDLQNLGGAWDFTVCNYKPPGNFIGNFAANVGKPLGKPVVNA